MKVVGFLPSIACILVVTRRRRVCVGVCVCVCVCVRTGGRWNLSASEMEVTEKSSDKKRRGTGKVLVSICQMRRGRKRLVG